MPIVYQALDRDAQEIRILILRPDADSSFPYRCDLEHVPLADAGTFSALSYVWGPQEENRAPVDVDYSVRDATTGESMYVASFSTTIGENLSWALLNLRGGRDDELRLWVDALCIDQADDAEKTWQVQLMGDIYAAAATTLVWLGPTADNRDGPQMFSLDAVALVADRLQRFECWRTCGYAPMSVWLSRGANWTRRDDEMESQAQRDVMRAGRQIMGMIDEIPRLFILLNNLAKCPWWTRAWVLQELLLANKVAFAFGDRRVDGDMFVLVMHLAWGMRDSLLLHDSPLLNAAKNAIVHNYARNHIPELNPRMLGTLTMRAIPGRYLGLDHLLTMCYLGSYGQDAAIHSTDPRDLIFALLGLANDALGIEINYALSAADVFNRASMAFLRAGDGSFLVLPRRLARPTATTAAIRGLESWAVNWSEFPYNGLTWRSFNACGGTKAQASEVMFMDPGEDEPAIKIVLRLAGTVLCTVATVGPTFRQAFQSDSQDFRDTDYTDFDRDAPELQQISERLQLPGRDIPAVDDHALQFLLQRRWLRELLARVAEARRSSANNNTSGSDVPAPVPAAEMPNWKVSLDVALLGGNTIMNEDGSHAQLFERVNSESDLLDPLTWLSALTHGSGWAYLADTRRLAYQSRSFASADGRVGYVPDSAEPGDLVVVFYGVPAPLVLGSLGNGSYVVKGPAYVHGVMKGEFVAEQPQPTEFLLA
ncbi:heterokaryon incompatibility protein-domain-containing protein [Lasiosphaeria miniovina]|uniref:Heterokaryon incompatibility protein-domain-containing protein n=1 Tax=Lasiosphaeria miniovina TaxID=1954250 RepID=A0AA40AKL0_9PEZI|nr:heterokaryon incompatibility protein-domain-containing protein [Lasiosphaeria miniovina]KAK0717578.1 heterokaryon incompatibility protein-domain-containing protein [Lasiosphaeria miniovina]